MLIPLQTRRMLRTPCQQIKCMRQHRQNRREGTLRPGRTPRQVHDQRATKRPAHCTTERSKRSLQHPLGAHTLRQSVDHPFADESRGLRRHIPRSQPRPACRRNQDCTGRMTAQRRGYQIQLIGQNLGGGNTESSGLQYLADCRPRQVELLPPGAAVADRQHYGANVGRKARSHVSQSTGFASSFINFTFITSTP
jgi:hypothetical protein